MIPCFHADDLQPRLVRGFFMGAFMDKYVATLTRLVSEDKQTLGALAVYCGTDLVFSCKTLELAWNDNKPFESCIPKGTYRVKTRNSETYRDHWHVLDVPNRDLILIHSGNYHRDTEGCIIVGREIFDIDGDGYRDVTSSRKTMRELNNALQSIYFTLNVV